MDDVLGPWAGRTVIVYDGDCPFCSRFVRWTRLTVAAGPVELVDARQEGDLSHRLGALGFDLDEGMVLLFDGHIYHGNECINRLALLSTRSGAFNRMMAFLFRSPAMSRMLYPPLRGMRNVTLRLLGRRKLNQDEQ